jgi:UDPglucose 6-dehydrogenase
VKLAVVGIGHVGLVSAAGLASLGHDVTGMDLSADTVALLQEGRTPFHEPGLDDLLREGIASGRLRFTTSMPEAVGDARVVFICVGRPPAGQGDRSLSAVEVAVRELAREAADGVVLVVKSTVPPGTTARVDTVVRQERPSLVFFAASSPEFLREGRAVADTLEPERLVIGADDPGGFTVLREVYAPIIAAGHRMIETDSRTAELSKLACNAFLATKVSFANALARVAELAGADVEGVTEIMGADPRIGPAFLGAGLGFGGYCLPKDLVTLEQVAARLGYDFGLVREAMRVNQAVIATVVRMVEEAVWNLEGKTVALLGVAFKPGTDDVRGAPALVLAEALRVEGAHVTAFDPMASEAATAADPELAMCEDAYTAATGAHCVVLCTEWAEFPKLDLERLRAATAQPVFIDARNAMDADAMAAAGFHYIPMGATPREPQAQ